MALRKIIPFLALGLTFICIAEIRGQVPTLKWQKNFGGSLRESYGGNDATPFSSRGLLAIEGGYIIAGKTNSNNWNITGNHGANDIWVAKLDTGRNIVWSVTLGGTLSETFGSIAQDIDGGYIVCGSSRSNNGTATANKGSDDVWVVKLSGSGIVEWQRSYGGALTDVAGSIAVVGTEGYIVSASTSSVDGDVSGNHGLQDAWILRLDRGGNILWQQCLGGTNYDSDNFLRPTADGGFIFVGSTQSTDGDVQGFNGETDAWLVKLSSLGQIQWQRCLGGAGLDLLGDIEFTTDGGYMVVGSTRSSDGDFSGNHGTQTFDAWAAKLTSTGQVQWQKLFGGSANEAFSDVIVMADGTYTAAGHAASSNGDVQFNRGQADFWLVRFNNSGTLLWQNTFGGSGEDLATTLIPAWDNEYLILGTTWSNNFDVSTNYGFDDIWLMRAGASNSIQGFVFYDLNSNGIKDNGEPYAPGIRLNAEKPGYSKGAVTGASGSYRIAVETGSFTTTVIPPDYFTPVPASAASVFNTYFNTSTINFALRPNAVRQDLQLDLFAVGRARPGFPVQYRIAYRNAGTTQVTNTSLKLVKSASLNVTGATPPFTTISTDTLVWQTGTLEPQATGTITIDLQVAAPPGANIGDTLKSYAVILPVAGDVTPANDTSRLKQLVFGAFDPNDKSEANAGKILQQQVTNGDWLTYLVRFQNTGNDTAFNVVIRDTLDARLDWSSFTMIASSHAYELGVDNNRLTWEFRSLLLPDSNVNEVASHGYIVYRVRPNTTLVAGDVIRNTASIYFDYNLPVQTNTDTTIVILNAGALPVRLARFEGVLNNGIVNLSWKTVFEQGASTFEVERSANGASFLKLGSVRANGFSNGSSYAFNDLAAVPGDNYYRLKFIDHDGKYSYSPVVLIRLKKHVAFNSTVYPNPSPNGLVTVNITGKLNGACSIDVLDMSAKEIRRNDFGNVQADSYSAMINLVGLKKGIYVIRVRIGAQVMAHRLLVQ